MYLFTRNIGGTRMEKSIRYIYDDGLFNAQANALANYNAILNACGFEMYSTTGGSGWYAEYWRNTENNKYLRIDHAIGGIYRVKIEELIP